MKKKEYIYGQETKCFICGTLFRRRDKKPQLCCSYVCRGKLQTRNATRECAVCGLSFLPKRPENKCCCRKCGTAYRLSRRKHDPMVRVRNRLALFCCSCISRSLRNKTDTTKKLLGYSTDQLKKHLESKFEKGMTWENYGKKMGCWSVDHIKPISKFLAQATIKEINALSNLQPMWHSENCRKRNKWENQ